MPILKPPVLQHVCDHIKMNAKEKVIHIDTINGYDDHIHVLMLLKHDLSISKQMQLLKGESAFWANKNDVLKTKLEWADKFFAASVSDSKVDAVRAYINNQQEHHKKQTFWRGPVTYSAGSVKSCMSATSLLTLDVGSLFSL